MFATTNHDIASNIACARSFIDQVWNGQRISLLADFLSADYVDNAYSPPDVNGLRKILGEMKQAFPDTHQTIECITAQDDMVVCRIVLNATHLGAFRDTPASGRSIRVNVYRSFRFQDGKIAEHWGLLDTANLLRQIGSAVSDRNACAKV
jgi:steroid delta-isomerase-like uncharacterized protein